MAFRGVKRMEGKHRAETIEAREKNRNEEKEFRQDRKRK
jgi:hypothetical protein